MVLSEYSTPASSIFYTDIKWLEILKINQPVHTFLTVNEIFERKKRNLSVQCTSFISNTFSLLLKKYLHAEEYFIQYHLH